MLAGEQRARAPETGRDLVEHEQQAVLVAEAAQVGDAAGRVKAHPPRSLHDRLEHDRGQLLGVPCRELAHVRGPGHVEIGVKSVGRSVGEDVLRAGRPRSCCASPRPGRRSAIAPKVSPW